MSKRPLDIIVNIILILLFPVLVLAVILDFTPELGVGGNWAVIIAYAIFALVVWIWDEKKQSKAD